VKPQTSLATYFPINCTIFEPGKLTIVLDDTMNIYQGGAQYAILLVDRLINPAVADTFTYIVNIYCNGSTSMTKTFFTTQVIAAQTLTTATATAILSVVDVPTVYFITFSVRSVRTRLKLW
jgi:hypothetical protein